MNRIVNIGLPAVTIIALAGGVAIGAGTATAAEPDRDGEQAARKAMASPSISWSACSGDKMAGLECGELTVPLDYSNLALGTMTLPVSRHRATDPKHRIGSVFTNPGGPGGAATAMTGKFAQALGKEVAARFDVVGVAPRGIEGNELAQCSMEPGHKPVHLDESVFPMTNKEVSQHLALDKLIQNTCAKGPRVLNHMSTADVARDMDLARRAVGDEKLTYYGISYGTYVGAMYASLFPNSFRALVVDGVIDPLAWATGRGKTQARTEPVVERMASGIAGKEAILSAIKECENAGPKACAPAATIRNDWRDLTQILRMGPVKVADEEGQTYTLRYDEVYALTMSSLYSPLAIPDALSSIHQMAADLSATKSGRLDDSAPRPDDAPVRELGTRRSAAAFVALRNARDKAAETHPVLASINAAHHRSPIASTTSEDAADEREHNITDDKPTTFDAMYAGVVCTDTVNPTTEKAFIEADDRARGNSGGFGQLWNWQTSVCSHWPAQATGVYRGPFNKPTSTPVLIIGTEHDPATPYLGATTYHRILPTSRLISVKNGFGHGALNLSSCVDKARTEYLITGKTPAADLTCSPDQPLFPASTESN